MAHIDNIKTFVQGGLDQDSASTFVAPNDYRLAYNIRNTGTTLDEGGYITNPESNQLITISQPDGLNKGIGGGSFEDVRQIAIFRYNSAGNSQISLYSLDTNEETVIFENLTDSGNIDILPLNPQNYIKALLINETYMVWVATNLEVGYTNLTKLANGDYGTVLAEDLSLLKPQCLIPPTGTYVSDLGKASNFLKDKLFQFNVQWVNAEFNFSAWSTWSKRIIPVEESTPEVGTDSTANNGIVVAVNIGSIRATTINIGGRYSGFNYSIIRSVDRVYVTALPDTVVDVDNGIYEAYDPATNLYSFVFYNQDLAIPVAPTETDLLYDYVWPANAMEKINGNILALADLSVGYERPATSVTVQAVGYNPNINVPTDSNPDPMEVVGNTRRVTGGFVPFRAIMTISYGGTPKTGDQLSIVIVDSRDASNVQNYTYTVPSGQDGDLGAVIASFSAGISGASYRDNGDGTFSIVITQLIYFTVQSATVTLFNSGPTVSRSIHTILDNSSVQTARAYYDKWGRPFPLDSTNSDIVPTPSYAQVNGQAIRINWTINNATAPIGAVSYQWLITPNNTVNSLIDVLATPLNYIGTWDAHANSPSLVPNVGTVGDTYQITTPSQPTDERNLGNGTEPFNTGDYVVYNGKSWDIVLGTFGDLTTTGNILAFKIDPLRLFNQRYSNAGIDTVLGYSFSPGDRCTLHYYLDGTTPVYINNPCVDLDVFGFDTGSYLVKMEKSATFDETLIAGKDVFMRLYSPKQATQDASTTINSTVWYEVGLQYPIVNGLHTVLTGIITEGDVYYKTRQYLGAIDPNTAYEVLATDFNFSDFYASAFWSNGRPRAFYDELAQTERKAITITSQPYVLGSKNNGLTRFFPANVYGESDGQTSSSYGAIQFLWQRGDVLVIGQELNIFYAPVNIAYIQLNAQQLQEAISEKLLNNGRYETKGIGVGLSKEAFCFNENVGYIIDPHRSEPFELTTGGVFSISGKMSKYFKAVFNLATSQGKKIVLFYNRYYNEVMVCIETEGGILTLFPFSTTNWDAFNHFDIAGTDVTATPNGAHCTASYNSGTGIVTYTPTANYVGTDVATFTFNAPGGPFTLNNCLAWTAGSGTVNAFSFAPIDGAPLSTVEISNIISVTGNDFPVPISITGDTGLGYSVNGGAYTSSPGTVKAGDTVSVRVTSSGSTVTATSCTLTIDSQSATFTVTTRSSDHFAAEANYGMTIVSIQAAGGMTGIPAGYNPCSLSPGMTLRTAYTTVTNGSFSCALTGTPVNPGHVQIFASVNGVVTDFKPVPGGGSYSLNFPVSTSSPDDILIAFRMV